MKLSPTTAVLVIFYYKNYYIAGKYITVRLYFVSFQYCEIKIEVRGRGADILNPFLKLFSYETPARPISCSREDAADDQKKSSAT